MHKESDAERDVVLLTRVLLFVSSPDRNQHVRIAAFHLAYELFHPTQLVLETKGLSGFFPCLDTVLNLFHLKKKKNYPCSEAL